MSIAQSKQGISAFIATLALLLSLLLGLAWFQGTHHTQVSPTHTSSHSIMITGVNPYGWNYNQ